VVDPGIVEYGASGVVVEVETTSLLVVGLFEELEVVVGLEPKGLVVLEIVVATVVGFLVLESILVVVVEVVVVAVVEGSLVLETILVVVVE
jgi:hypothetical protein